MNEIYAKLDPAFNVPYRSVRIIVPFELFHKKSGVVLTEGHAVFENGKSIVLTYSCWKSITGPINAVGTYDHTVQWVSENPDYEFRWKEKEHIRIE